MQAKKVNSIKKGQRTERSIFKILSDKLDLKLVRRLDAARSGGCDSLDVPGWSIEIKSGAFWRNSFWDQAELQSMGSGVRPVLFFKPDRKGIEVYMHLHDLSPLFPPAPRPPVKIDVDSWCELVKLQNKVKKTK